MRLPAGAGDRRGGTRAAPSDSALIELRGEAKAGLGDVDGALGDWRLAVGLDGESTGALYSSAFLLEREGRLTEAMEAWRAIIEWNEARGFTLQAVWPTEELERLRRALALR